MKRKIWLTAWLTLLILAFAGGAAMADETGEVAETGGTQYATLEAAIGAVNSNETVTLLTNVTLADTLTITDKTFTLDFAGHELTSTVSVDGAHAVSLTGTSNVAMVSNGSGGITATQLTGNGGAIAVTSGCTLTVESADLIHGDVVEIQNGEVIKMNFYSPDTKKYYTTMTEVTEDEQARNISMVGDVALVKNQTATVQAETTLTVGAGKKLEVSEGATLTVDGALTIKPGSTLVINGGMTIGNAGVVTAEVDSTLKIKGEITCSDTNKDGLVIWTDNVTGGGKVPIQSTKYRINYGPAGKVYVLENTVPDDGLLAKGKEVKLKIFDEYRPWFTGWTVSPAINPPVELKAYEITFPVTRACTVTATFASPSDPEAAPLKVTPGAVTVEIGKTARLVASKDGAAVAANWLSNALRVVSVDENGLVYGLAEGSTTVTAMFGNERASCTVTVTKPVTPGPTPGPEGEPDASETVIGVWTDELAVAKKGALELPKLKGSVIEWTSDNLAVARIGKKGLSVVGLAFGEATLTGIVHGAKDTSLDGRVLKPGDKLTVKVCVRKPDELAKKIVPSSKKVTLAPQETAKLTASVSPASAIDDKIYWKSENPKIATVTKDGTVTAVAPGKVKIVALSTN
ncbi:MAG: Ig-like domain-containing protein, partial [Clostridia bacterium]